MARAHVDPEAWARKHRIRMIVLISFSSLLLVSAGTVWILKKHILPERENKRVYTLAEAYLAEGKTLEAIDSFSLLWGYGDAAQRAASLAFSLQPDDSNRQALENACLGDVLTLGSWEQDGITTNGPEPIAWIVVAESDGRILLLSEKVLDSIPYHETKQKITWADCSLRAWLNESFFQEAFAQNEKALVVNSVLHTADNPASGTDGGADTQDHAFVLSFSEFIALGASNPELESFAAVPTVYAVRRGVERHKEWKSSPWWLRTPGVDQSCVCFCDMAGSPIYNCAVSRTGYGVRPAIWVFASTDVSEDQTEKAG